jgi:anti-sigma-K factor RskA
MLLETRRALDRALQLGATFPTVADSPTNASAGKNKWRHHVAIYAIVVIIEQIDTPEATACRPAWLTRVDPRSLPNP